MRKVIDAIAIDDLFFFANPAVAISLEPGEVRVRHPYMSTTKPCASQALLHGEGIGAHSVGPGKIYQHAPLCGVQSRHVQPKLRRK